MPNTISVKCIQQKSQTVKPYFFNYLYNFSFNEALSVFKKNTSEDA